MSTANIRRIASVVTLPDDATLTAAVDAVVSELEATREIVDMQREAVRNIGLQNDGNARDARHYAKLAQDAHDALDEVGAPNFEAGTNTPAARIRAYAGKRFDVWVRVVFPIASFGLGALASAWILS